MTTALKKVHAEFGRRYPLLIGGREVFTEQEVISRNPADLSEVVGSVARASRAEADIAIEEAKKAWAGWSRISPEARAGYLVKAAAELRNKRFELAALEVLEVGKTWKEADADVAEAIDHLEYYAGEMVRLGSSVRLGSYPGEENDYIYEPRGAGIVISPWKRSTTPSPIARSTGRPSAARKTAKASGFGKGASSTNPALTGRETLPRRRPRLEHAHGPTSPSRSRGRLTPSRGNTRRHG